MNTDPHLTAAEAQTFCQSPTAPGPLTPAERLVFSDHLAGCAACRALVAATAAARPPDRWDRLAPQRQDLAAAAHEETTREAEDLQAFARALDAFPAEHFAPGDTLPPPRISPPAGRKEQGVGLLTHWWTTLFSSPGFVAIGVAALALLAVLATATFFRTQDEPPPRVASAVPPLLRDGPVVVAADGSLQTSAPLPDDLRVAMIEAISRRALRAGTGGLGTMRGDSTERAEAPGAGLAVAAPFPVVPASGSIVEDQRPTLRWTGVPAATEYQVVITSSAPDETMLSPRLSAAQTRWQPETPLVRGRIYHWRVLIGLPANPSPEKTMESAEAASLKVLGTAGEEELRRLRAAPGVSHFALAVAYARLDLRAEAKRELEILSANDPHSTLAAQWRASLN